MSSNTLIIYNADSDTLADIAERLKADRGKNHLTQVTHLKSFGRVLAIFADCESAAAEMLNLKTTSPPINVVFAGYTDLHAQPRYLALPDAGTLWFTSPPMSPTETWEQAVEEEPNKETHFDSDFSNSLAKALQKVRESGPVSHSKDDSCSCTIYQSPTETLPDIRIDWMNCEAPNTFAAKQFPHTAMP